MLRSETCAAPVTDPKLEPSAAPVTDPESEPNAAHAFVVKDTGAISLPDGGEAAKGSRLFIPSEAPKDAAFAAVVMVHGTATENCYTDKVFLDYGLHVNLISLHAIPFSKELKKS